MNPFFFCFRRGGINIAGALIGHCVREPRVCKGNRGVSAVRKVENVYSYVNRDYADSGLIKAKEYTSLVDIISSNIGCINKSLFQHELTEERPRMVERNLRLLLQRRDLTWGLQEKFDLLLKLYEKSIDCMEKAVESIQRGEVEKEDYLVRAQDIVLS